jgi:hypothetical protein
MITVEDARANYRPKRITTLFVAESAPVGGTFFYYGNGNLGRYLQRAVEAVIAGDGDFRDRFKSFGWYLDDLARTPINHLTTRDRNAMRLGAQDQLSERIAEYRPLAVVCLLISISDIVRAAALKAGFDGHVFSVPFPGNGQQRRFHQEMIKIIPSLPKEPI